MKPCKHNRVWLLVLRPLVDGPDKHEEPTTIRWCWQCGALKAGDGQRWTRPTGTDCTRNPALDDDLAEDRLRYAAMMHGIGQEAK